MFSREDKVLGDRIMNENILNNFYCWDFLSNFIKFCSIL